VPVAVELLQQVAVRVGIIIVLTLALLTALTLLVTQVAVVAAVPKTMVAQASLVARAVLA
jgi:hypothetical protein